MKITPRNLRILSKKVRWYYKKKWYGFLTPTEILTLCKLGLYIDKEKLEYYKGKMNKGDGSPLCFYFEPSTELLNKLKKDVDIL